MTKVISVCMVLLMAIHASGQSLTVGKDAKVADDAVCTKDYYDKCENYNPRRSYYCKKPSFAKNCCKFCEGDKVDDTPETKLAADAGYCQDNMDGCQARTDVKAGCHSLFSKKFCRESCGLCPRFVCTKEPGDCDTRYRPNGYYYCKNDASFAKECCKYCSDPERMLGDTPEAKLAAVVSDLFEELKDGGYCQDNMEGCQARNDVKGGCRTPFSKKFCRESCGLCPTFVCTKEDDDCDTRYAPHGYQRCKTDARFAKECCKYCKDSERMLGDTPEAKLAAVVSDLFEELKDGECMDYIPSCGRWATKGLCLVGDKSEMMKRMCRKSCGLC